MVDRGSVIIRPDGSFLEYKKSALSIRNIVELDSSEVNEDMYYRQIPDVPEVKIKQVQEIQQDVQNMLAPQKLQDITWSNFLIILAAMLIALYSIKVLVNRIQQLRRDEKEDQFCNTLRSSLLVADVEDEWRMQKIDTETPIKRNLGENVFQQQQSTKSVSRRSYTATVSPKQTDDEFKRS